MRQWLRLAVIALIVLACGACSGRKPKGQAEADPGQGIYQIYYLDASGMKLCSREYTTDTEELDTLAGELAGQLLTAPPESDFRPVLDEDTQLLDMTKNDSVLYLNFNKGYMAMDPVREALCRAAFAKTLIQVEGIEFISINCEGQPLLDSFGSPVGAFSGSDFVEGITDINAYEKVEVKLYFANEEGTALAPETREVFHNISTSLERLIVEQLIEGPLDDDLIAVLPEDTKVLSVSVADGICYVNFDSSFLSGALRTSENLPIYGLVNSLTELSQINKVQITVDGSQEVMYRDVISLSQPFERDVRYIEGGK